MLTGERGGEVSLVSALATLDKIAGVMPLRPMERTITRDEAASLIAHIRLLQSEITHWESKCTGRHGSQAACYSGSRSEKQI